MDITIWIDEAEINIGDSLIGKIRDGLDSVDYVAVVLSKASIKSEWVKKEIEIASNREIEEKKVLVLPLVIENVELPGFLKGKFYGDFSNEENYEEMFQLLLRSLPDSTAENEMKIEKDELQRLKEELAGAQKVIDHFKSDIDKISEHSFENKSEDLQNAIIKENKSNPKHAPINNVYAFEIDGIFITLGYILHVIRKLRMKGAHQFEPFITSHKKWNEVDRMLGAYKDMIERETASKTAYNNVY